MACEDCLEVCFKGLVVGRMCVVPCQLSHLWDLDKQEQKGVGDAEKSSIRGGDARGLFS